MIGLLPDTDLSWSYFLAKIISGVMMIIIIIKKRFLFKTFYYFNKFQNRVRDWPGWDICKKQDKLKHLAS